MDLLEPEPERENELDESENEVRKVGALYKSYDMARDKRWSENVFDGKHNMCHEWACNIMCDVRAKCPCLYMQCENVFCSQFEYNDVFLTFDSGFRLGQDEDGDKETLIITLETKSPTTFAGSLHLLLI